MPEQLLERDIFTDQQTKNTEDVFVFDALEEGKGEPSDVFETQKIIQDEKINKKIAADKEHGIKEEFIPIREAQYQKEAYLNDMDLRYYKEAKGENPERKIYNKEGVKHLIKDAIVEAYASKNKESLAQYARFAIDINGLKAVNDLAGHEVGDIFLNRAVDALGAVKIAMQGMDFDGVTVDQVEISHEGGDEFGLFIESNTPMTSEVAKKIAAYISKELQFDCGDLLTNEIIREKGQAGEPPLDKEGNPYRFHASAGVGVATFKEVLINSGTSEELELRKEEMAASRKISVEELTKDDIKNLLMGMILDETDERMIEDKKECKTQLDPFEQKLLLRNEEMKLMQDRFVFLSEEMKRLKDQADGLQRLNKELSYNLKACMGTLTRTNKN